MIFTTPISIYPDRQVSSGDLPLRESGSTSTWLRYRIQSSQTEELDAFNKTDLNPDSEYEFVLKLGFGASFPGADDLRIELEGDSTKSILSWDKKAVTRTSAITSPFTGGRYAPVGQNVLLLIPRDYNMDELRISLRKAENLDLEWVLFERVIGFIYPSLAFKGQLAKSRQDKTSITGQTFTTVISPDKILRIPIVLKNEPDDSIVGLLDYLDSIQEFGVIPNGLDSTLLNSTIPYRRDGLVRNMVVSKTYRGFSGHQGVDVHGASGRMELRETYHSE